MAFWHNKKTKHIMIYVLLLDLRVCSLNLSNSTLYMSREKSEEIYMNECQKKVVTKMKKHTIYMHCLINFELWHYCFNLLDNCIERFARHLVQVVQRDQTHAALVANLNHRPLLQKL